MSYAPPTLDPYPGLGAKLDLRYVDHTGRQFVKPASHGARE